MEFETLQKIIAEVLDVEEDEITMDTRLLEDLGAFSSCFITSKRFSAWSAAMR